MSRSKTGSTKKKKKIHIMSIWAKQPRYDMTVSSRHGFWRTRATMRIRDAMTSHVPGKQELVRGLMVVSEGSKRVERGSVMLVDSRAALRADHPLPSIQAMWYYYSSSVPLDFCKHLFSRDCYIWMSLGLCSLQLNESNQNIHFYGQIFWSISIFSITALPSTL